MAHFQMQVLACSRKSPAMEHIIFLWNSLRCCQQNKHKFDWKWHGNNSACPQNEKFIHGTSLPSPHAQTIQSNCTTTRQLFLCTIHVLSPILPSEQNFTLLSYFSINTQVFQIYKLLHLPCITTPQPRKPNHNTTINPALLP